MDWDLQAIVRGCTSSAETPGSNINMIDNLHLNYSHFFSKQDDDLFFDFHEFSETTAVIDELEELYKPFYPASNNDLVASSLPKETEVLKPPNKVAVQQDLKDSAPSKCKKSKKKKNEKKRVKQVREAEDISDGWAWRKYGQKAMKGSPYPRSYYRCSSCKGCMARKKVERSRLDPQVFILTYTAQHDHPQPTRKNPQAGCTRNK